MGSRPPVIVASEGMLYGETPFGRAELARVYDAQPERASRTVEERVSSARAAGAARAIVDTGVPAEGIVRTTAAERAAMIVMGTHGRGGLPHLLLGRVADRVLRTATCPILRAREDDTRARRLSVACAC